MTNLSSIDSDGGPVRKNKQHLIDKILDMCTGQPSNAPPGYDIYPFICSLYQSCFGGIIYRSLIKSIPAETPIEQEPNIYTLSQFVPSIKQALTSCSSIDIEHLSTAVSVKAGIKKGSAVYCVKNPKMESFDLLTLLSKVFQYHYLSLYNLSNQTLVEVFISKNFEIHDRVAQIELESIIFEVMAGRGYPSSILDAIRSASIVYVSRLDAGQPAPGSFNDRRRLERKEAHIQHAATKVLALETAKQKWPQPIPYSTIMECIASYRQSIQFKPFSICASCGTDDCARTGSYIPISLLSLDILRVTDTYILAHTPLSRFKYIHDSLDGLLLEPKGIRALDKECSAVEVFE
ncbi:hypothetical protein BT96DRAFT_999637 [Gymnopus androsaceus JB14]|uniref:Uncharacterized protein n=1 Tax=Gymnopus androsaceus JB14 TaxID=1447944 RepID=A0A6A4H6C0_9AGAR|nr:hypothetical protein BT96DRAFT_999637 [Gymnopus androsaceus JB14]